MRLRCTPAENYVDYLRQAYLPIGLQTFSFKSRERARSGKSYAIDTALIATANESFAEQNTAWRLENIVCLELFRRRNVTLSGVYCFKNGHEVDFVLAQGSKVVELIQVWVDISTQRAFNREVNALFRAATELRCNNLTLITLGEDRVYSLGSLPVNIVSVLNWLKEK